PSAAKCLWLTRRTTPGRLPGRSPPPALCGPRCRAAVDTPPKFQGLWRCPPLSSWQRSYWLLRVGLGRPLNGFNADRAELELWNLAVRVQFVDRQHVRCCFTEVERDEHTAARDLIAGMNRQSNDAAAGSNHDFAAVGDAKPV